MMRKKKVLSCLLVPLLSANLLLLRLQPHGGRTGYQVRILF